MTTTTETDATEAIHRAIIIGAGFGGIGLAYYLRQAGIGDFVILEKADDLGGTWRENTYPGAACDVPSHLYSYSFEPHYPWASRYGSQAEILEYIRHCANKFDLTRHIRYNAEVSAADFDAGTGLWTVTLADGSRLRTRALISGVGQLHRPSIPNIPGLATFRGTQFHSARWDHGYDFNGKSVAVIGTGASAVQFVPIIAQQVARLDLYQRSPGWVIPKVERRFSRFERWLLDTFPIIHDLDRLRVYLFTEALAYAYDGHKWAEKLITWFSKAQLRIQVRDPALRKKLTPDFPIGCKRILLSLDWLRTMVRPNVEVVTDAIAEITTDGVRTVDGRERKVDAILFGTGFAATQFLTPMRVTGRDGLDLHVRWQQGAEAYLGMTVNGFPNFYMLYGPNTNVGSGSIIFMLECQQRYIVQMIEAGSRQGWSYAEVREDAHEKYVAEMRQRSAQTTFEGGCQSWYTTADGRNTNNWVGLMREFRQRTAKPELTDYRVTTVPAV
ncbi:MAG TPA: NAD(P)/FAD-dependent oxidoreductase [Fontimonas sp.]